MRRNTTWVKGLALCVISINMANAQSPQWVSVGTTAAGLDSATAFCLYVTDINNDRYPDIIAVNGNWAETTENTIRVYLNTQSSQGNGNGRMFVDITPSSGVNAKPGGGPSTGTLAVALADVNNDGNVDLVRGNYYHRLSSFTDLGDRCEVLLGDGQGHFVLVPNNGLHELGLINVVGFSFLDYNKDGNIDLFIAPWFKDYDNNIWEAGYLMKGNGDGTFTNVSAQAGISQPEPMYGCSAIDWNNDGWPDIATAPYCRTDGQLWKNNGDGTFTNVAASVDYNARYMQGDNGQNLCMWGNVPEDYDNDGDVDFFFNLVHGGTGANEGRSTIVVNSGPPTYSLLPDRSLTVRKYPQSSHLGDYDASWLDLDNDGHMDLIMTQGHYGPTTDRLYVFYQGEGNRLTDITSELGLMAEQQKNLHRMEVGDFDLDGDDDILYCRLADTRRMHLLENRIGQDNHWTAVHLQAPAGVNKSCIGARVYVWAEGKVRFREVYAGRGNGAGQQPFALIFGLGNNNTIDSIGVRWPDAGGTMTTVVAPPGNRYLEITGDGLVVNGPHEDIREADIAIYPNPAKGDLFIQPRNEKDFDAYLEVYDVLGRRQPGPERISRAGGTLYYPVKDLSPGQYMIRFVTRKGQTFSRVFVKAE
jgi:hypothetical protein